MLSGSKPKPVVTALIAEETKKQAIRSFIWLLNFSEGISTLKTAVIIAAALIPNSISFTFNRPFQLLQTESITAVEIVINRKKQASIAIIIDITFSPAFIILVTWELPKISLTTSARKRKKR